MPLLVELPLCSGSPGLSHFLAVSGYSAAALALSPDWKAQAQAAQDKLHLLLSSALAI